MDSSSNPISRLANQFLAAVREWSRTSAASPPKVDIIQLEERIFYSASPFAMFDSNVEEAAIVPENLEQVESWISEVIGFGLAEPTAATAEDSSSSTPNLVSSESVSETTTLAIGALTQDVPQDPTDSDNLPERNSAHMEGISRQEESLGRREVVFIDHQLDDLDRMLQELQSNRSDGTSFEFVWLEQNQDGLSQISTYLSQSSQDFDAIHIISHGNAEGFQLGSIWMTGSTVVDRFGELQQWNEGLSQNADLLIYGCYVAATDEGQTWLNALGSQLGVDVAASTNLTGHQSFGGDWILEYATGQIESSLFPHGEANLDWQGTLAFTTNNDTASTPNNVPITVNVGSNDTGSPTILDISNPSSGSATYSGSNIIYTPTAGYTGSTSINYLATDGTEGLQHYWKLDGNGTDAIGSSHGTLTNGPTTTTGRFGSALLFDEVNDHVVVSDIAYASSFTISFAFNISDNSGTAFQYLYSHGTVATQNSINIYIGESGSGGSNANFFRTNILDANDTGTGSELDFNAASFIDGNWHTYTLTISATTGATVYIDGVQRASNSTLGRDGFDPTSSVYFGGRNDLEAARFMGGSLDGIAIYNNALSGADVAALEVSGSAVGTLNLTVGGAAAVNTVPGSQNINEDATRVFSSANGNQISIADSDAGGANNEVTISVNSGTLTLAGTTGLTFVTGDGTADTTMTVRGTAANINTALNGLTYNTTANYNGTATLTLATEDASLLTLNLDANLQGHYEFTGNLNDTAPGTAKNGSFNGNATIVTDATRGQVLSLDGSGDYVRIAGTYSNPTEVTIGGWVNLTSAVGRGEFISLSDRVHLALDEPGLGVKGSIQTGASSWVDLASGRFIAGTGWHHVMFVYSDSGNNNTLYIDGVVVASASIASSIYWTGATDTLIGVHPSLTAYTNGFIDDARIYNRALSATEIAVLASDLARLDTDNVLVNVAAVNDAPVLDNMGSMSLTTITESQTTNSGNTVASIISSAGGDRITDVDSSAVEGIAIYSLSSGNGTWQFSTNSGSSWSNIGTVSESSALLLRSTDLVRFVPNGVNGTEASFLFRAWDQSSGTAGTNTSLVSNGGTTAFSSAVEIARIIVTESNSTPTGTTDTYSLNEDSSLSTTWWNTAWTRRSQLTFTGNNFVGSENMADFPVLIAFNSSNIDYALTQNSGQDLRFVDADGTALAYEIESWNEAGTSFVWVRVPNVAIGSSDSIFVYYGNASASAGEAGTAVWSSSYAAVYHMDDPGLIADDSTIQCARRNGD